ncbi:MAG TPA: hypothetical protein VGL13_09130, partial [Polyangiaceae bacterium]
MNAYSGRARLVAAALVGSLLSACSTRSAAPPKSVAARGWRYEVNVNRDATELGVEATFPPGTDAELGIDDEAEPFVHDVAVADGAQWRSLSERDGKWTASACSGGCRIRYRFALAEAAKRLDEVDFAVAHRGALVAPPSTWLLRPLSGPSDDPYVFHVAHPPGVSFATGVFPWEKAADTYGAPIGFLASAPYTGIGAWRLSEMSVKGGKLEIGFAPGSFDVGESAVTAWIVSAADVVARYYRHFPVSRALLLVVPSTKTGFGYGKTLGNGGASIVVPVGERTTLAQLDGDWVLVHEMFHLAFPDLPRAQIWLSEGLATYLEPIARARAGRLSAEAVWLGMLQGLPNGLPEPGDEGLDRTHTWGRTYWGGALFCLLADLEIRKRTENHRSLDDALRAILDAGGSAAARWELPRVLQEGDAATGVSVLSELHGKMGSGPSPV